MAEIQYKIFSVGSFQSNCTMRFDNKNKTCIVFDPGEDPKLLCDTILANVKEGYFVPHIFLTHSHIDHVAALSEVSELANSINKKNGFSAVQIHLHKEENEFYQNIDTQSQMFQYRKISLPSDVTELKEARFKDKYIECDVIHVPGHSPGSCGFYLSEESKLEAHLGGEIFNIEAKHVFIGGDLIFLNSVGRSDLWKGDAKVLSNSIKKVVKRLPPKTLVITGHGPWTVLENEIATNPFFPRG